MSMLSLYKLLLNSTGTRPLPRIEEHLAEPSDNDQNSMYAKMVTSESGLSVNPSTSEDISVDSANQAFMTPAVSSPDTEMVDGSIVNDSESSDSSSCSNGM